MVLLELNSELARLSDWLIGVEYWATKGLRWVHSCCILSYEGSLAGPLKFNIELPMVSGGLIGVQY